MLQDINVEHTIKELMGTIKTNQSLQLLWQVWASHKDL